MKWGYGFVIRLGVDVGGTNTDAVLMDGKRVIATQKCSTTSDVSSGIVSAIRAVLEIAKMKTDNIACVMIGTTQFTNALVERRHLQKVGVIRLSAPAGKAIPAMMDWPKDLQECIGDAVYCVPGGYEFDGREISSLDEEAVSKAAIEIAKLGIQNFAVTGVFSPLNQEMEIQAQQLIEAQVPGARVTLSSDVGRVGFLERENAAILNATLSGLAIKVVNSFQDALDNLKINAPLFISQNDGTLISADEAVRYPVMTIGSGPTNSMRGAAYLTGVSDAIVIDVGGTTSDIGVLINGFPRESSLHVDIGGVRTNFRMPDALAIGLGGGTKITIDSVSSNGLSPSFPSIGVGPESVGYNLEAKALVFGGDTLTSSDVAVASGRINMGNAANVSSLGEAEIKAVLDRFRVIYEEGIDRMKTSIDDAIVIVVGGGSFLVPDTMKGISKVVRPEHSSVANAVGAAIAQVGVLVDRVVLYEKTSRSEAIEESKRQAIEQIEVLGGDLETLQFVDIEEVSLSYLPGRSTKLRVKAVASLKMKQETFRSVRNVAY